MNDALIAALKAMPVKPRCKRIIRLAGKRDEAAVSALLDLLGQEFEDDPERDVHWAAVSALEELGTLALGPLIAALSPRPDSPNDAWRRYWVAMAIGRMRDQSAIEPLIRLCSDSNRDVASAAVESLVDLEHSVGLGHHKVRVVQLLREQADVPLQPRDYLADLRHSALLELEARS